MTPDADANREPMPVDVDEVEDTGHGRGGPASVIYGDGKDDEADEAAEGCRKPPTKATEAAACRHAAERFSPSSWREARVSG